MKTYNLSDRIAKALLVSVVCFSLYACADNPDDDPLPPPPVPEEPEPPRPPGASYVKYVKVNGSGHGTSWDDALSPVALLDSLNNRKFMPGDTVCMAAGTYTPGVTHEDVFTITESLTFLGGYAPDITGKSVDITYPNSYKTIITGDRNGDNIAGDGDARAIEINSTGKVVLKGIEITGGYATDAAGMEIYGASTLVEMYYCKIHNNQASGTAGGIRVKENATLYCYKTEIVDNKGSNRGGGLKIESKAMVIVEACLIARNSVTGDWGGAVHRQADGGSFYCINTTVTENSAGRGGGLNFSNNEYDIFIVSSTIAANSITNATFNEGLDIRCESPVVRIINSIVTNTDETRLSFYIQSGKTVQSSGNNLIGILSNTGLNTTSTDILNQSYTAVFGSNTLDDNGGNTHTILPVTTYTGSSYASLQGFYNDYIIMKAFNYDLSVDQRGVTRDATASTPGACEK